MPALGPMALHVTQMLLTRCLSCCSYVALRILGVAADLEGMQEARAWVSLCLPSTQHMAIALLLNVAAAQTCMASKQSSTENCVFGRCTHEVAPIGAPHGARSGWLCLESWSGRVSTP